MNNRHEVLRITNAQRASVGAPPLKLSRALNLSAQACARREARGQVLKHYPRWWALIEKFARKEGENLPLHEGENIGDGQDSASAVCAAWRNSPEHWANIKDVRFHRLGVGVVTDSNGVRWWVQHFGS